MDFKEFFNHEHNFSEIDIASMYFQHKHKVRDISSKTGKSIAEIYRTVKKYGSPNRNAQNHQHVLYYADNGFSVPKIAEFTKYSPRNIRYILKKNGK